VEENMLPKPWFVKYFFYTEKNPEPAAGTVCGFRPGRVERAVSAPVTGHARHTETTEISY
jgi:hypothetical protein